MIELKGKYNNAKVFTDVIDNATTSQLITLLNQPFVEGSRIRIMADTHAGKGCVIGTTMTLKDKIVPNLVGVDIGCFTGDTEVWCSAGYYKTIKELADSAEKFLTDTYDEETSEFYKAHATAFKTRENAELMHVKYGVRNLVGNRPDINVRCTPDHKFLVCYDGDMTDRYKNMILYWCEAKDLKVGMQLVAEDDVVIVKGIEKIAEREDVYCLNVPETHNFAIRYGVIVHNCGMHTAKLKETRIEFPKLDSVIRKNIPSGGSIRDKVHKYAAKTDIENLRCLGKTGCHVSIPVAEASIGSLGGGNHFIEVDTDENGNKYLVVHTGSRRLGKDIAEYYQQRAFDELSCTGETLKKLRAEKSKELIEQYKKAGKQKEISKALAELDVVPDGKVIVPFELAYVQDSLFDDYIHDMEIAQEYAYWNRKAIIDTIVKEMKWHIVDEFETIHNYIDIKNMILRKGSISAQLGERVLIPINMRDGSILAVGKGNEDYNFSAPHGAGRLMSRSVAKESISMPEFKESMKGIYTTCVNKSTLDESPMAYKDINSIIENIKDTVDIIEVIKPVYNFKASEEE